MKQTFKIFPLVLLLCAASACGGTSASRAVTNTSEQTYLLETPLEPTPYEVEPVSYEVYEPFGLRYDPETEELYFEEELVRYFFDGVGLLDGGQIARCEFWNDEGTIDVHTVREVIDNGDGSVNLFGELIGLERYSQEEFDARERSDVFGSLNAVTEATGEFDPTAETFADRFETYREFGIEYVESESASGVGNVYYQGKLVNIFADISPEGGAFSFHSMDGGEIDVQTVYDDSGKLTGVEPMA